jgi:hypothetical protein
VSGRQVISPQTYESRGGGTASALLLSDLVVIRECPLLALSRHFPICLLFGDMRLRQGDPKESRMSLRSSGLRLIRATRYFRHLGRVGIELPQLLDRLLDALILAGARPFKRSHVCFSVFDFVLELALTDLVQEFVNRLVSKICVPWR